MLSKATEPLEPKVHLAAALAYMGIGFGASLNTPVDRLLVGRKSVNDSFKASLRGASKGT